MINNLETDQGRVAGENNRQQFYNRKTLSTYDQSKLMMRAETNRNASITVVCFKTSEHVPCSVKEHTQAASYVCHQANRRENKRN